MTTYYAHSCPKEEHHWQKLEQHLNNVGLLAAEFAAAFDSQTLGEASGKLHDLGKYTQEFQQRLHGGSKVSHATHGALIACKKYKTLGTLLAYGIAGHHAGLANGTERGERPSLKERLASPLPLLSTQWQQEITLPEHVLLPARFVTDNALRGFQLSVLVRMLFSCLVDADFLDTKTYYRDVESSDKPSRGYHITLTQLQAQLGGYLSTLPADGDVNPVRKHILQTVRSKAASAPGVFTLTVPTGGGKTLASLAFALDHAITHGLQRVISVIPFTSVVEQTASVFRRALGPLGEMAVLEHHSAFIDDGKSEPETRDKLALAMENWDAPIIVTTSVQFFESLYAARPSRCRKLHRIASSVVILDEAQAMPLPVLRPCVTMLGELARNYRTSIVLCTATQPALLAPEFPDGFPASTELAPDPAELFRQLERVSVAHVGVIDDQTLAARLADTEQVLCIVNSRRHARALYERIAGLPGAFHLSTLMCAKHRQQILSDIKERLKNGEPVRLVSTSLIEAGVDVDFAVVWRAEAGLDAIAQAAGRCNREGRRPLADSVVRIFSAPDWPPPKDLRQFAATAQETLRHCECSPLEQEAIQRYFQMLYWEKGPEELDTNQLLTSLKDCRADNLPMETLAENFRMIDSPLLPVLVPFDDIARHALRDLAYASYCGKLARQLQPYIVQIPRVAYAELLRVGAIQPVQETRFGQQFMQLLNENLYDGKHGLSWDNPAFIEAEKNIW